jgi:hypothetical protein
MAEHTPGCACANCLIHALHRVSHSPFQRIPPLSTPCRRLTLTPPPFGVSWVGWIWATREGSEAKGATLNRQLTQTTHSSKARSTRHSTHTHVTRLPLSPPGRPAEQKGAATARARRGPHTRSLLLLRAFSRGVCCFCCCVCATDGVARNGGVRTPRRQRCW